MGAIFKPTYRDRRGQVQQSAVWWVRYRQHGKTIRQSTETDDERKARKFLQEREGRVALNVSVSPKGDRLTLDQAAQMIRNNYAAQRRKSSATLGYQLAHVLGHFRESTRLSRITTGDVERYKAARLVAGAAPATVNRELSALARMGSLARHQYGLAVPFVVKKFE